MLQGAKLKLVREQFQYHSGRRPAQQTYFLEAVFPYPVDDSQLYVAPTRHGAVAVAPRLEVQKVKRITMSTTETVPVSQIDSKVP